MTENSVEPDINAANELDLGEQSDCFSLSEETFIATVQLQKNKEINKKNNKFIDELFNVTTSDLNKMFTNQKHLVSHVAFDSTISNPNEQEPLNEPSRPFQRIKELERILSKTMFQLNSVQAKLKENIEKSKIQVNKKDASTQFEPVEDNQRPKRTKQLPELKDGSISKDSYGKDIVSKSVSIRIDDNLISFDAGESFLYRMLPIVRPIRHSVKRLKNDSNLSKLTIREILK